MKREAKPEKPRGSQLVGGSDELVATEVQELLELLRRGEGASEWQAASLRFDGSHLGCR
jgi:hypothetical protein